MKKLLFFILLFFVGVTAAFAQAPTHEQLTYQTVVRNAQNQLVFNQNNVTVKVYVCSDAAGSNVVYSETHTGLSTNANGMLSMMIGSVAPDEGTWDGIDWSTAYIKTTISYGSETITHDPAPVTAVPYALSAGNTSNITNLIGDAIHDSIVNNIENNISEQIHDSIVDALGDYQIQNCDDVNDCVATAIADGNSDINHAIDTVVLNNIGDAIHDSIVNNISEQIHDSITNYLTVGDYVTETDLCTTIEANCTNVALRNGNTFTGDHDFTEASSITVPNAIVPDLATVLADTCNQKAVNLCDLLAVFDSLCRRIEKLENAIPPVANAPTVSNVTSTSMNVKANATSQGAAITSYEFCYSTNSDMSGATCQTVLASDADNVTFTGLDPNTNYYVQYSATNFAGTTTSPTVQERTLAHAPTADVTPPAPIKPAGFDVHVDDVDPKEKDEATVQVCYVLKGSSDCPEKESPSYSACTDPVTVTDGGSAIISQTGLEASTEYCVIVKVSNEDSTTIYGPFTVTTGADVTMTISGPSDTNRCGAETIALSFMATITGDDANDFTYEWSAGTSTTALDTVSLSATTTITVTATHTTEGYTLTATKTTTVGNNPVSIGFCENEGIVSVKSVSGAPNSIDWGDGQSGTSVSLSTTHDYATLGNGNHEVTITASNASGCILSRTMTVNVLGSGSTAADRTVKPCSVGSHPAQTGSAYTGNGHGGASYGLETVNGSDQVTSVTDYDGNAYPVVQIGSQCWMAENLRVSHSPKTGSNIVVTAVNNNGSKMAAWYNNDQSTYEAKRYGLLYNWCAAMDTANPSGYVEVATAANTSNYFSFTPSGNHQGVCPVGWHVPTDAEWNAMELEVNGSDVPGSTEGNHGSHAGKLSTGCDWSSSSTENAAGNYANAERNSSGFSAVPAGNFYSSFKGADGSALFWSSSQNSSDRAWSRGLLYNSAGVNRHHFYKYYGFSVRCVRDTVAPAVRPVLSVSAASGTVNLCGETTAEAAFTATPSSGNASDFTYTWSTGATASGNTATYSLAAGIHTVYVTATHTTEGYDLTASTSVTVGNDPINIGFCENEGIVSVKSVSGAPNHLEWGDGDVFDGTVNTSTNHDYSSHLTTGSHSVTITASNADGCTLSRTMTVTIASTVADRTVKPCSVGSHPAQTTGIGNATDGMETVESGNIVSVKDYDDNEYPVVEIGSQCWMAVNLRTTHYADGSSVPAGTTSNSSTTAPYYYDYSSSSIPLEQRGYLYNWPAAMKSTTTEGTQGVCPTGWHLPTDAEWNAMELEVNGSGVSGSTGYRGSHAGKLSTGCDWSSSSTENAAGNYANAERNSSGFSAVPAGYFNGSFNNAGNDAYFWSSSQGSSYSAWYRGLYCTYAGVYRYDINEACGYSVRCVRDLTPAATLSVTSDAGSSVNLCGETTVDVPFTATITGDDASDYTFAWSSGTSGTSKDTVALAAGTHTITVTATSSSHTLTASTSVTVSAGGTAATLKLCEEPSIGKVLVDNTNCTSLSWKNSSDEEVSTSLTELAVGGGITAGVYTVTGVTNSGCSITKQTVLGNYSPRPCTSSSMGSHTAQSTGFGNAFDGLETVESGNIISVKDYDGIEYPVVEIGSQCWMAVNLRTTHYADGSALPAGTTSNSSTTDPYYYDYSSSSIPLVQRGYLYNWPAAMKSTTTEGTQGVCPTGWHVPTDAEWNAMELEVNGSDVSGSTGYRGSHAGKLSTGCDWSSSSTENAAGNYANAERNESGFSAVPAGYFNGSFYHAGDYANFWCSSRNGSSRAWYRSLNYDYAGVYRSSDYKNYGWSVRCVRDN